MKKEPRRDLDDILFDNEENESLPIICVIGVGGGGGNAVSRMVDDGVEDIDFFAVNTDTQALKASKAPYRIKIGNTSAKGNGAGSKPDVGRRAAEESRDKIEKIVDGADMVFITAGMGGGTGTGAAPYIANVSKSKGILTIGVVTKPFKDEGSVRMNNAENGINELLKNVDTLVVIPNEKLLSIIPPGTSFEDSLRAADETLNQGVRGIADLILRPGLINLDFADISTVMTDKGLAHMGVGRGSGKNRAMDAAQRAANSALLETSMEGATSVLVNISGGKGFTLDEYNVVSSFVNNMTAEETNAIVGVSMVDSLGDEVEVTIIATGFSAAKKASKPSIYVHSTSPDTPRDRASIPPVRQSDSFSSFAQSPDMATSSAAPIPSFSTPSFADSPVPPSSPVPESPAPSKKPDAIPPITEKDIAEDVMTLPVFLQGVRKNTRRDYD